MKLLISNQHGAIVMALMPFLYGMLLSNPIWQHVFFLLAWFSLYLMTYPFLNLFKGRNLELYIKWSWIYFFACVIFAIPVLIYNWHTALFVAAMLPFVLISIYYVKQKDERVFKWFGRYCDFCHCRHGILLISWPHFWWQNLAGRAVSELIFYWNDFICKIRYARA